MRSKTEANQTNATISAQLIAAKLSEPMRRALLSAQPTVGEPEWDVVADYCTGHEVLRADYMGRSFYCEGSQVCHQAREAYKADREPDPDVLHIEINHNNKIGTVVALMDRGICLDGQRGNDHQLTDLGYQVHAILKAQQSGDTR